MTTTNQSTIINFINEKRTIEDIVSYLVLVEGYKSKAEARTYIEEVMEDNDLTIEKKVPMSHQLKAWYLAQGTEALDLTKDQIEKQAKAIGMTKGSLKYYTDMYTNASEIAKQLLDNQ